jgi:hypothetical protein
MAINSRGRAFSRTVHRRAGAAAGGGSIEASEAELTSCLLEVAVIHDARSLICT